MVKTNQDIIDVDCFRSYDGMLAVSDEDKKIAWKSYHEKLLNTDFVLDRNSLSHTDTVGGVTSLKNKEMVRESILKAKNGKAAARSGLVSEMVKAAGEAEVHMITDLVNQIVLEGFISAEWELNTIVNYY